MATEWYGATRLMPDKILKERVEKAQLELKELLAEQETRKNYPEDVKLAFKLHGALCVSHDCDWGYQDWKAPIMTNIICPNRFLTMANKLIVWTAKHTGGINPNYIWIDELIEVFKQK